MKFKSNIELQAGVEAGGSTGSNGQVLSSTGSGVSWIDQNAISAGNAEHVVIYAKNTHTASIAKGTPVYITGTVGATDTVEIAPADASDSAKMPAVGLLDETLAVNAFGYVVTGGFMDNITTDPIDGTTPSSNDTVYVKAGGGLTLTKPTGPTGLIQNVAKVGKVSGGNSGSLIVSSILRTNDVPNLTTGKIWVGDGNTVESTVVHLDEVNGRMGVGTNFPAAQLHLFQQNVLNSADLFRIQHSYYLSPFFPAATQTDFVIKSTGNVGIGTTSPGYKLHVNGNLRSSNITIADYIIHEGDTNTYMGFPSIDTISWNTNGSERMRINSSGNVGIGTTSAVNKLQIDASSVADIAGVSVSSSNNSTSTQIGYTANNVDGSTLFMGVNGYGYTGGLGSNYAGAVISTIEGAQPLVLGTDSTERMRITETGNVGIGTTSPSYRLQIGSDGGLADSIRIGSYLVAKDTRQYIGYTRHDTGLFETASSGNTPSTVLDGVAGIRIVNTTGTLVSGQADNSVQLLTHIYNGGSRIALHANYDGNVGIGTTSPTEKLHIRGIGTGIKLFSEFPAESENSTTLNHISFQKHVTGAPQETIKIYNVGTFAETGYSASDLRLAFNNNAGGGLQDKVTFKWNGDVGIGTTSPSQKLSVEDGSIKLNNNNANADYYLWLNKKEGRDGGILLQRDNTLDWQITNLNGSGNLNFYSYGAGGSVMGIQRSTGNVGIGTTNPLSLLSLGERGSTNGDLRLSAAGAGANEGASILWDMIVGGGNSISHISEIRPESYATGVNKNILNFYVGGWNNNQDSGTAKMTITSDGNVGIGTTSPSGKLHVYGGSFITDLDATYHQGILNEYVSTYVSRTKFGSWNTSSNLEIYYDIAGAEEARITRNYTAAVLKFNRGTTTDMIIDGSGNVGIGTTSPGAYKLNVSGTGKFTSTVTATNFILSSDINLKENIVDYKPRNLNLKWKEFDWKESKEHQIGLIAQEVEETNPEFVVTNQEGEKSVKYIEILIAKIAELEDRIKILEE
jgi:hypothetical protein